MIGLEKDILILISRIRCMTETQVGKFFTTKRNYVRKPFKKTLRKMCGDYTLRKYPCNINHSGYKDNSYVYYLNGSKTYKGNDLLKVVVGSELAIKLNNSGYKIRRFYRNPKVDNDKYDIFIEYSDKNNEIRQILVDIEVDKPINMLKYENIEEKIKKCTIPFFEIPKVIVVTSENKDNILNNRQNMNIEFIDFNLTKLTKNL